jgi:CheY-like chemotaxis protein
MAGKEENRFCPKCGRKVEVISVSVGMEGIERLRCANCGSFIDEKEGDDAFKDALLSDEGEQSFSDDSIVIPTYDSVVVAGYRPEIMNLIVNVMTRKNIAREVMPCENGEELIIKLIQDLNSGDTTHINLAILDVAMPYLNGINAAIGVRAIEKNFASHSPVPILFLTRKPIDDTFKKVIKYLTPAKYAGLGPSDNPKELGPRLSRIISLLSQESW